MTLIEARGLTKVFRHADKGPGLAGSLRHLVRPSYREHVAVDGIDLTIGAGEAVAYLGPNGAGKSTTVKLLTGILVPTAGQVRVCGLQPHRQRRRNARNIGVVFGQRSQLWWDLPVRESLALLRDLYRVPPRTYRRRLERFDEVLGLGPLLPVVARKLSLGQRMRADLAAALLHHPPVVYLDEPTIGLDVDAKDAVRAFLRTLRADGTTLLLTTHDIADIEATCRRIVIIDAGRVVFDGSLTDVRDRMASERVVHFTLTAPPPEHLAGALHGPRYGFRVAETGERGLSVGFDRHRHGAADVIAAVAAHAGIADLWIEEPSIVDVVRRVYAGAGR